MASVTDLIHPGASSEPAKVRPMIVAQDAHVTYRVYASGKRMSSRDAILNARAFRGGREQITVPAVRGVSFTASEGETIGVVGHNGSGKSTLFRAMSGLIPTSKGAIWAADRPVLLGVNAALVPELSGENNIKLGLLAMGFTPEEAAAHVGEIADFAELNDFLYHPMRTYSSGMGARLRFAIASARAHSILLIDEALSVGDRRFKVKSEQRIRELRESAGLVMIVSHSAGSLRDTCDRVLWIHKGELRADGDAKEVIADYVKWTKQPGASAVGAAHAAKPDALRAKESPATGSTQGTRPGLIGAEGTDPDRKATRAEPVGRASSASIDDWLAAATVNVSDGRPSRAAMRRDSHRRSARQQNRRRILGLIITGGVIVLSAAAGAAVALLAAAPDRALGAPRGEREPVAAELVSIEAFSSRPEDAACDSPSSESVVQLSWSTTGASTVALASAVEGVGSMEGSVERDLPSSATAFVVPYPCSAPSWTYTLWAEGAQGDRVSKSVEVLRELTADTATSDQQVEAPPGVTPGSQSGGPGDPPVESSTDDVPQSGAPTPQPSALPSPTPIVTPPAPAQTPEPEESAEPEETPIAPLPEPSEVVIPPVVPTDPDPQTEN